MYADVRHRGVWLPAHALNDPEANDRLAEWIPVNVPNLGNRVIVTPVLRNPVDDPPILRALAQGAPHRSADGGPDWEWCSGPVVLAWPNDQLLENTVPMATDQTLILFEWSDRISFGCSICRIFSFYSIDEIGQSNTCPRCGNSDQFAQERWRVPIDEPPWSYDLHPLGRNLGRDNGDVSLLLAAYLRNKVGNQYSDAPEVVAIQSRKTIAEADLLAVAAGILIVVEAKRNGELGRKADEEKASIRKRLKLAEIFNADEIVIATTQSAWRERSLNAMKDAIDSYAWPAGIKPRLRVVTSLAQNGIGVEEYM
jgi:hypothetical protein